MTTFLRILTIHVAQRCSSCFCFTCFRFKIGSCFTCCAMQEPCWMVPVFHFSLKSPVGPLRKNRASLQIRCTFTTDQIASWCASRSESLAPQQRDNGGSDGNQNSFLIIWFFDAFQPFSIYTDDRWPSKVNMSLILVYHIYTYPFIWWQSILFCLLFALFFAWPSSAKAAEVHRVHRWVWPARKFSRNVAVQCRHCHIRWSETRRKLLVKKSPGAIGRCKVQWSFEDVWGLCSRFKMISNS